MSAVPPEKPASLTLATYNIHRCVGSDGRFDPHRIIRVIRELNADVIALQEVEILQSSLPNILDLLTRETEFTAIAGPTLIYRHRHYGNALISRLPVIDYQPIDLSLPGREPRGAIDAHIECRGVPLQVVATHLGLQPAERRIQIQRLLNLLAMKDHEHLALMGDLNEWFLWGRPLRWLHAYFAKTPAPATFPSCFPLLALDRIWMHPQEALIKVRAHATRLARAASDHLPLKAMINVFL